MRGRAVAIALAALALVAQAAGAQTSEQRVREQQQELDRIRSERAALEAKAVELRSSIHDLSDEVANLDRQADATSRLVGALDKQLGAISDEVNDASAGLVRAEDELATKRAVLHKRVADIYKRGPMYTTEALLSAQSFGELVARYKYLHLLALRDRALVNRVQQLRDQVANDRNRLVMLQQSIEDTRSDKAQEEQRLRDLEKARQQSLASAKRSVQVTETKLARLRRTEEQLTNAIASFEAERRRAESRPNATRSASSISTRDYGRLDWPVDGQLLYTFGKAQTASNTTIRWNGVGIKAGPGTGVHAVASGKVVSVRQLGTYGLTVIVDHGGGDYSVYGSLGNAAVSEGQSVSKGQLLGSVGMSDPDLPPHLHFEIRHGGPAVDPAAWLRDRQ